MTLELPQLLLVDDDLAVGQAFSRRARCLFRVTTTTDPKQALDILRTNQAFAAILSDLFMPSINGVTFLRAARTLAPRSKCYLFTGKVDHGRFQHDMAEAGIARMFFKPLDALLLNEALKADLQAQPGVLSRIIRAITLS